MCNRSLSQLPMWCALVAAVTAWLAVPAHAQSLPPGSTINQPPCVPGCSLLVPPDLVGTLLKLNPTGNVELGGMVQAGGERLVVIRIPQGLLVFPDFAISKVMTLNAMFNPNVDLAVTGYFKEPIIGLYVASLGCKTCLRQALPRATP
jgi:hypothetical protein